MPYLWAWGFKSPLRHPNDCSFNRPSVSAIHVRAGSALWLARDGRGEPLVHLVVSAVESCEVQFFSEGNEDDHVTLEGWARA